MTDTRQLCTFALGSLLFGVEVVNVQEVIRCQEMTKIPLASAMVRGLINLRGQIVTAIDLRARLELPGLGDEQPPMNVVLRTSEGVVSLLVDEIGDVLELDGSDFERPPETLSGVFRDVVPGVYKLEGRLLLVLDVERIIALGAPGEPSGVAATVAA
ncbi:MAG TPA: chemotaxis protein CheW [Polyangiaceae bacterium]|nr:chemotaxis protein CheW [Polyangiaceae bacterium]